MSSEPPRREPLSDAEVRLQFAYLLAELGEARSAIRVLEDARKTHDKRIVRLMMGTTRIGTVVSGLKRMSAQHANDLNQLGQKRVTRLESLVGTAKALGWIAIALTSAGITVLVFFLHFLDAHIVFKP